MRDASTCSTVMSPFGPITARGCNVAECRCATATAASCSDVVPYSCMWRRATIAKSATRVVPSTASKGLPSLAMCSTAALRSAAV